VRNGGIHFWRPWSAGSWGGVLHCRRRQWRVVTTSRSWYNVGKTFHGATMRISIVITMGS